jgi:tetratricopeptide (TPR) repeat protein
MMSSNIPDDLSDLSKKALLALHGSLESRKEGDLDRALALCQQAVQVYRDAARLDGQEKIGLGRALMLLGEILSALGSSGEALDVLSEVVDLNMDSSARGVRESQILSAAALEKCAEILADLGRAAEASESITRAIDFHRHFVSERPESYKAIVALARSLNDRAMIFAALDRSEEAILDLEEAIRAYRAAIAQGAREVESALSRALQARIAILNYLGEEASYEFVSESVNAYRRAVQLNPSIMVDSGPSIAQRTVVEIRPGGDGQDIEKRRVRVMQGSYVELTEAIDAVRSTLAAAGKSMTESDVQFEVGPVELEFAVELQRDAESRAGVRVMVMTGANDQKATRSQVNRIKLTITPINRSGRPVLIGDVGV